MPPAAPATRAKGEPASKPSPAPAIEPGARGPPTRQALRAPAKPPKAASRADRPGGPPRPRLRVRRVVPADNVGRNAPALTHREPIRLSPGPDPRAVLTVRGRSPLCPHWPHRCLARVRRKAADRFVEPFAVPQA